MSRKAKIERTTKETRIEAHLNLDGTGVANIKTGIGFLDHMIGALAKHARFDLVLHCVGDLEIDDHHTAEDCAIVLGQALDSALGERRGIERFGDRHAPLDEALARAVVDLSGRPWAEVDFGFKRPSIGQIATENLTHFVQTLAIASRSCIHLHLLRGENDHHRAEAGFKALARSLKQAVALDGTDAVPSTKGVL